MIWLRCFEYQFAVMLHFLKTANGRDNFIDIYEEKVVSCRNPVLVKYCLEF